MSPESLPFAPDLISLHQTAVPRNGDGGREVLGIQKENRKINSERWH